MSAPDWAGDVPAEDDVQAIRALIGAHFDAMRWDPSSKADWSRFSQDFIADASLFPTARPVRRQSLEAFIERMEGVAQRTLHTFEEKTLGMQVLAFGNVAVVLAGSQMLENSAEINQDVSGYLLLKDAGKWRIAAHAWDKAGPHKPLPEPLREP